MQIKALGSVIQRAYFDEVFDGKENKDESELIYDRKLVSINHFDIFVIDYLAELSAFDGKILEDQSVFLNDCIRYILSLYRYKENPPNSVILIGYSMGGLIARSVFTLDNYINGSVRTIFTINSPHLYAPILLEKNVKYFYDKVNDYWRNNKDNEELSQVSIVSIAGGWRDLKVRGGLSNLEPIIGNDRAISTLTSSVPNIWTSNDHETSVWCNQFLSSVASGLYRILDPKTSLPILDVNERMNKLRENFVSKTPYVLGFEQSQIPLNLYTLESITQRYNLSKAVNVETSIWMAENKEMYNTIYKWDLKHFSNNSLLQILTSIHPSRFSTLLCDNLECIEADNFASMPYEYKGIRLRWTLKKLHFLNQHISSYSQLFIVPKSIKPSKDTFIIVKLEDHQDSIDIKSNLLNEVNLHSHSKILHNFTIPSISRFHAYHVSVNEKSCSHRHTVNPIIMQYTEGMREERYNTGSLLAKFHQSRYESSNIFWPNDHDTLHIVFFGDPFCEYTVKVKFSWPDYLFAVVQMYMPMIPSIIFIILIIMVYYQLNLNLSLFQLLIKQITSPIYIFICLFASIINLIAPYLQNLHPIFSSHSFKDIPKPHPSFIVLLGLFVFGYCVIVAIGSVHFGILWLLNKCSLFTSKPNLNNGIYKSNSRNIIILYVLLVSLTFLTHSAIPLGLSLVILILPIYKTSVWQKHIVYILMYLLFFGIMAVNLIIFLKNLNYEYRFIDSYELLTILIITHIILIKFTEVEDVQSNTPQLYNLLLIACANATYFCLFPLYRILDTGTFIVSVLIVDCLIKYQIRKKLHYDKEK